MRLLAVMQKTANMILKVPIITLTSKMNRFLLITLAVCVLTGINPIAVFSQNDTIQSETTLSKKELRKLKKQQAKVEKVPVNENVKIQVDSSENFQEQPKIQEVEEQVDTQSTRYQKPKVNDSSISQPNNYKSISSNENQNIHISKSYQKTKKSLPDWVWFALIIGAILVFATFGYRKKILQKFAYNIFSIPIIVILFLSFGSILLLQYLLAQSSTGELWGITSKEFYIVLIIALVLIIGILYYYNLKKTNWYLAIINVVVQSVAVGVFVILTIGWIILKFLSNKSSPDTQSNSDSSVSSFNAQGQIQPYYGNLNNAWKWDGKILQPYYGNLDSAWRWDGKIFQPYYGNLNDAWKWDGKIFQHYYGNLNDAWKIEGNIPIPIIAKAIRII